MYKLVMYFLKVPQMILISLQFPERSSESVDSETHLSSCEYYGVAETWKCTSASHEPPLSYHYKLFFVNPGNQCFSF